MARYSLVHEPYPEHNYDPEQDGVRVASCGQSIAHPLLVDYGHGISLTGNIRGQRDLYME
jgi:hypothetical protein